MSPLSSPKGVTTAAAFFVLAAACVSCVSAGTSYRNRLGASAMANQWAAVGGGGFPAASPYGGGFANPMNPQAGSMNYGGFGGGGFGGFGGGGGGAHPPMGGGGGGGRGGGAGGGGGLAGLAGMLPSIMGMIPSVLGLFGGGGGGGGGGGNSFGNGGGGMPAGANQGSGGGFPTASQPGATGGGGGGGIWTNIGGLISQALPLITSLMGMLGGGGGGGGSGGRGRSNNERLGSMMTAIRFLESKQGANFSTNDPAFQAALRNALQTINQRAAAAQGPAASPRYRRQALNPQIAYECPFAPLNMTECGRLDRVSLTECTSKNDCGGEEFCCLGGKFGCDFVCTKPIMPEIVHSGSCPAISMSLLMKEDTRYLFESCKTECQVDEDCGSNEKCCDYILGECQQNVCLKAV